MANWGSRFPPGRGKSSTPPKNARTGPRRLTRCCWTDSGRTRIGVSRWYYGENYNEKHRFFSELPPEERKRYFQETVSGVAQGARPVGDLTTAFDTYPGREQFSVIIDNYGVTAGKYLYFNLPFTPSLIPVGADQRALPLLISQGGKNTIRTEIELPPEFRRIVVAPQERRPHRGWRRKSAHHREGKHSADTSSPTNLKPHRPSSVLTITRRCWGSNPP